MTDPTYAIANSQAPVPKRNVGSRITFGHLMIVVSGLLAFLLTITVINQFRGDQTEVLVARDNIVAGESLEISKFEVRQIPSNVLNDEFATREMIQNGNNFAARSILEGEPLTRAAMTPDVEDANVWLQSIPISRSLAVNGSISRGDRVDIIATPDGTCAYRALRNIEVVSAPTTSSGGVLSSNTREFTITVSLEQAGDDLILAGVIATGQFQIVKSTGDRDRGVVIEDPQCGNPPTASNSAGSGGA